MHVLTRGMLVHGWHLRSWFAASASASLALAVFIGAWRRRRPSSLHAPGSEAAEIEAHILRTQVPARALGIRLISVDAQSLSLSAPLDKNRNVHGTAFAGSLYAVGVLSAYYLARAWVRREGLDAAYELVAKSGKIDYKKPVQDAYIVARSALPSHSELAAFRATLEADGKAFVCVPGSIVVGERTHVEYEVEVCAFRPRRKQS